MRIRFVLIAVLILAQPACGKKKKRGKAKKSRHKDTTAMSDTDSLMETVALLEERVRQEPSNAMAHAHLAMTLQSIDLQRHEGGTLQPRALHAYETAISLGLPADQALTVRTNVGILLNMMGRPADTLKHLDVAIAGSADPKKKAEAHYYRAQAFDLLGRREDAELAYRSAIDASPGFARGFSGLVGVLSERGTGTPAEWAALRDEMSELLPPLQVCRFWPI